MAFQDASPRVSVSTTSTTQSPSSAIQPVRRTRNNSSRKRKSFVERFLFTFGTKRFKRLKKATQNFFAYVSVIILGVAGVIYLIKSMLGWW